LSADTLFKIVIKDSGVQGRPDVLAFIYPQIGPGYTIKPYNHERFLTSVDEIEQLTGLDFLTTLADDVEKEIEKNVARAIWNVDGCVFHRVV